MIILNLGCGTRTSDAAEILNIDWSITLRLRRNPILSTAAKLWMNKERRARFSSLSTNILVHDLSKGIPFANDSVDAIYHSHVLEHLDRHAAIEFLSESKRALRPGGVLRIVVPDFESLCKKYINHIALCNSDDRELAEHDKYISEILEQCVRKEASGSSQQSNLKRKIENLLLGDARRRGETHQWMYDRISLTQKLLDCGYSQTVSQSHTTSLIPRWDEYKLDVEPNGTPYKDASIYIEAVK